MASVAGVLHRTFAEALRRRDLEEAERALEHLEQEEPASARTRGSRLELLIKSGRIAEAEKLAPDLVVSFSDSGRILFLAGQVAYRARKYDEAVRLLRESHRLHESASSKFWLAKALRERGDLDEAEAAFEALSRAHHDCSSELAFLYERRGDHARALDAWNRRIERVPADQFAKRQRDRLSAKSMLPEDLVADLDALEEWGEPVPEHLVASYLDALLKTAQGARARDLVLRAKPALSPKAAVDAGWAAHKLQAFDLSFELFVAGFPANRTNAKFLAALERAARTCGRTRELIDLYKAHAPEARNLYGRLKSIAKADAP